MEVDGPVYIRLAKGGDEVISSSDRPCKLGLAVTMMGTEGHLDVLFITCGITTQIALRAAEYLNKLGRAIEVLHFHTIKPFDAMAVLSHSARATKVFSVEEHVLTGGLGSAAAEVLAEANFQDRPSFKRLSLPNVFFREHGSQNDILAAHGLTPENLVCLAEGQ
jgi:transketolase